MSPPQGEKRDGTEFIGHEFGQAQHVKGVKPWQDRRETIADAVAARTDFRSKALRQVGGDDRPYGDREYQNECDQSDQLGRVVISARNQDVIERTRRQEAQ